MRPEFATWEIADRLRYRVHYIEKGIENGDNHIVLLHGFAGHSFTWRYLVDPLVKHGFHVWCFDFLGFGFSSKSPNVPYCPDLFMLQLLWFLKRFKIQQTVLIGHSMGASISLKFAIHYPEYVKSLVLLAPVCYPLKVPLRWQILSKLSKAVELLYGKWLVKAVMSVDLYNPKSIDPGDVDSYDIAYRLPHSVQASVTTLKSFSNQEVECLSRFYCSLSMPILLLWGEHDATVPVDQGHRFVKDCLKATLQIIPCAGHCSHEEKHEAALAHITKFLQSCASCSTK